MVAGSADGAQDQPGASDVYRLTVRSLRDGTLPPDPTDPICQRLGPNGTTSTLESPLWCGFAGHNSIRLVVGRLPGGHWVVNQVLFGA